MIRFWEIYGSYSGYKEIPNLQRSHFQYVFKDSGFLVDITLKVMSGYSWKFSCR